MPGPHIITLGCRLNIAESEAMRGLAQDDDRLVIVNSCAVTAEAVKQTRQAIRRARRERPDARILVTGCAAEVDPAAFAAMPEVDEIVGNRDKLAFKTPAAPAPVAAFSEHARAFVEVQNGCDHSCTFCVIPQGRGTSRSIPAGAVIDRIKSLVDEGHAEVVLTGVDVTSYGSDLPGTPSLGLLVERILRHVPALPRLRLSSLDSVEIDDRLFDLVTSDPRVMPHLHLSLQSGDDMILKRMKRRHSRADAIRMVERLKSARPAIAIGADLIAGFPTETEAMFANSLALIDACDIVHAHIFPYSPRPGTPAALMPQVDPAETRDRARRLREAAATHRGRWLANLVGTRRTLLVERSGVSGHGDDFAPIRLATPAAAGQIAQVDITAVADGHLMGALA